ncbi:MAG: polysaccharide export protein [Bacteroidales bacterium]|nr:polysaccharide export protein [Bacteroidales bacterium]
MTINSRHPRPSRLVAVIGFALLAGGCYVLPAAGPNGAYVKSEALGDQNGLPYDLVELNAQVAAILATRGSGTFAGTFTDRRPPSEIPIGIGDVVSITIFEAQQGGLFIPAEAGVRPGNFVTIPDQVVDRSGFLSVPYAGRIPAANRGPAEVQAIIEARLRDRAIDPQVVVAVTNQRSSQVSVLGEVNSPVKYPLTSAGDRILDALARAGGPRGQDFDTWITLQRGGREASIGYGTLIKSPSNNIYIQPEDTLIISRQAPAFMAFGASGANGQFKFEKEQVNLAEGMAMAGGLVDDRAEPSYVFLYRLESREVAEKIGIDLTKWETRSVPVIYSLNLRNPGGFFLARKVPLRDKDIIYVANADGVEWAKFLQFVRLHIAVVAEADSLKTVGQ